MLGVNRDVNFWDSVAFHPEVAPFVFLDQPRSSLSVLIEDERNVPFASENGGVLFVKTDHLGSVYEMHTLFTPGGWGREVALTGAAALHNIFRTALIVFTYEQEGHWRSRPPKGHGNVTYKVTATYVSGASIAAVPNIFVNLVTTPMAS